MNNEFREYMIMANKAQVAVLQAVAALLGDRKSEKKALDSVNDAIEQLSTIQPPPVKNAGGRPVGSGGTSESEKLYLYQWAGEEPLRVSYEEASAVLGNKPHTLRCYISTAHSKSIAIYKQARWHVLAKSPDGLQPALDFKFNQTRNPDDQRQLTKRAKPR